MKNLSPFRALYWKEASKSIKSIKVLTVLALLISARVVLSSNLFSIMLSPLLKISFSFIIVAITAYLYGPFAALISGFISDIASFFLFPTGFSFFPGYTLNAMLSGFIFALFLYRSKPTLLRFGCAKFLINVLINILLGSLWKSMLAPKSFWYYASAGTVKNLAVLPLEIFVFMIVIQTLQPFFIQAQLLPEEYYHNL